MRGFTRIAGGTGGRVWLGPALHVAVLLLTASTAYAEPDHNPVQATGSVPTLRWWSFDSGGGPIGSAGYWLDATLAQPDVDRSNLYQAGGLSLRPGYWGGMSAPTYALFANGFESSN